MSRERTDRNLVQYALLGIVGTLVALGLAANVSHLPLIGGGETTYHAEFADASGLAAGEEVRIAGVKAGRVTDIALARNKVIVTFTTTRVAVGDQSTAGIEIKTLLGQHYLSLQPLGAPMEPGATIPLRHTTTPLNIVPAFNELADRTSHLDVDQLAKAFTALSEVLDSAAPELRPALNGLERLSRTISTRDQDLRTLFARTSAVSGVIAARDDELVDLLENTRSVLKVLDRRRETINVLIDGTADLAKQLRGLVRDNEKALSPTLRKLDSVLAVLEKNRDNLDEILDTTALYQREFTNVGGTGHWFDSTIKVPRGFALCAQDGNGTLVDSILNPILSDLNQAVNDSDQPCLPLGPAGAAS